MATSVVNDVFGKEELLFAAVATGTLEQYKDLLNSLGDVDVRGVKQRTLLYVAVGLGKVDWVEGLLEKGANPGLRDVEGVSVVELAKGMVEKYPENEDRQSISKLVRLVMKVRDSVAQGGCNTTSTSQDAGMEAIGCDMISVLSRNMASMCESTNDIHRRIATIDVKVNDIQSRSATIDTLREEIKTNRDLINDAKIEMATINTHAMQEISTIRNSIDDVKAGLAARDVLLSALESSVTSLANRERPVGMTRETSTVDEEVLPSTPRTEEDIREECVEAMVLKTSILESDEGKVTKARAWYEKLYSKWDETACLLKFLKNHDDVSVEIDFDSYNIGGMKSSFTDHDGVERDCSDLYYFADFEEKKVYLGGGSRYENVIIGWLAGALAQMSVCLAFNNGGKPYEVGDRVTERQMKNALKEAEEEYRRSEAGVEWFIEIALDKETQRGKEIYLTSAVPLMIARYGSTHGTDLLQPHFPLLLQLFRDSVMPALLAKAQV